MFKSKTLFIVGAGASREADLPIGKELTSAIAKKLNFDLSHGSWAEGAGDAQIYEAIKRYAYQNNLPENDLFRGARKIRDAMPQAASIDNFVDAHSTNRSIVMCGKLAITQAILEAEQNSKLIRTDQRGQHDDFDHATIAGTWYVPFFRLLVESVRNEDVSTLFDNVSFIVFNYDRCIEHYLYYAIRNYFSITDASTLMSKLKVYHPYGVVGYLPWQSSTNHVSFGGLRFNGHLLDVATKIRTFTERVEGHDPTLTEIRREIQEAEQIVFLGFGYYELNMKLLGPEAAGRVRRVFGTAKGISDADVSTIIIPEISAMLKKDVLRATHVKNNLTCCELFDEYWHTLSRG
jgi:hypothetical protein